ncbi:MAG: hypothetical protein M0Z56_06250 [Desulfobacteraceae bacterium]|nr:hypothetical protein [Desulfobacteraceae bacterium]
MRIKKEFKKSGFFWLPRAPGRKIPGTLKIIDGGDIELEVIGLFDETIEGLNNGWNGVDELERIIGHIEKHGLVTLDGCFYKNKSFSFGGISKSTVYVSKALLGVAYEDKEPVLLSTFQFSVEGIDEWVGLSGIKVENQFEKRTATITYSPPAEVSLSLNNEMKLLITFSWSLPGFPNTTEAKITQKTRFKLLSDQERPLNDFISAAYIITTLLCFAIDQTVCIDGVTVTVDSLVQEIGNGKTSPVLMSLYYSSLPYTKNVPKIHWHHMLFRFMQIRADAERIINNWFDAYKEIDPALNLYFSAKSGAHKYIDGKFLALVQSLETYHRRTSKEKLMEDGIFKELTDNLILKCQEDKREWLAGRLQHGNELNLGKRIKSIIEPFKEIFGSSKARNKLIRNIVNTRNYLTHYDKFLESKAASGESLWLLCIRMEAIFQLHLLQVLGFTEAEIKSIFDNSQELQHKINTI